MALYFVTPDGERLHSGRSILDNRDYPSTIRFVRLLIAAKNASKATQRVIELRVITNMEDDFEPRAGIRSPVLTARILGTHPVSV